MLKISGTQWQNHRMAFDGYCTYCDEFIEGGGVEPDATGYTCEQCDQNTLMGAEEALIAGHVVILARRGKNILEVLEASHD